MFELKYFAPLIVLFVVASQETAAVVAQREATCLSTPRATLHLSALRSQVRQVPESLNPHLSTLNACLQTLEFERAPASSSRCSVECRQWL